MLELLRVMGRLGIEAWCYNWMAVVPWSRTSVPSRPAVAPPRRRLTWRRGPTSPVPRPRSRGRACGRPSRGSSSAWCRSPRRRASTRAHPDDPPLSPLEDRTDHPLARRVRPRLRAPAEPGERDDDVPGQRRPDDGRSPRRDRALRRAGRIHFVHFRDVRGTAERFVETFVDDGPTDMAACVRAYVEVGWTRRSAPTTRPPSRATAGSFRGIRALRGSTPSATCRGCSRPRAAADPNAPAHPLSAGCPPRWGSSARDPARNGRREGARWSDARQEPEEAAHRVPRLADRLELHVELRPRHGEALPTARSRSDESLARSRWPWICSETSAIRSVSSLNAPPVRLTCRQSERPLSVAYTSPATSPTR